MLGVSSPTLWATSARLAPLRPLRLKTSVATARIVSRLSEKRRVGRGMLSDRNMRVDLQRLAAPVIIFTAVDRANRGWIASVCVRGVLELQQSREIRAPRDFVNSCA